MAIKKVTSSRKDPVKRKKWPTFLRGWGRPSVAPGKRHRAQRSLKL